MTIDQDGLIVFGWSSTLELPTDDESESGGECCCWLHPGVSPPGDAALQLDDDESNSEPESGCMFLLSPPVKPIAQ